MLYLSALHLVFYCTTTSRSHGCVCFWSGRRHDQALQFFLIRSSTRPMRYLHLYVCFWSGRPHDRCPKTFLVLQPLAATIGVYSHVGGIAASCCCVVYHCHGLFFLRYTLPLVLGATITSRNRLLLMIDRFLRSIFFFIVDRYGSTSSSPLSQRTSCNSCRSTS